MNHQKHFKPGTVIGRLVVIGPGDPIRIRGESYSTSVCQCQCDAKTVKTIPNTRLRGKHPTLSCGCLLHESKPPKNKPSYAPRILGGYRYVYAPDAACAYRSRNYKGYAPEHRLIVERALGRPIRNDEHVHHVDGNKLNNEVGNLIVLTRAEHVALHGLVRIGAVRLSDMTDADKIRNAIKHGAANKPSRDVLLSDMQGLSYRKLGAKYGVCASTVRDWIRGYGIPIPDRPSNFKRKAMSQG